MTRSHSHWIRVVAVFAGLSLLGAACGNDDDAADDTAAAADDDGSDRSGEDSGSGIDVFCQNAELVIEGAFAAIFGLAFDPSRELIEYVTGPLAAAAAEVERSRDDHMPAELSEHLGGVTQVLSSLPAVFEDVDLDSPDDIAAALDALDGDDPLADDEELDAELNEFFTTECGFSPGAFFGDDDAFASPGSDPDVSYLDCDAIDRSAVEDITGAAIIDVTRSLSPEGGTTIGFGDTEFSVPLTKCSFDLDINEFGPEELTFTMYVPDPDDDVYAVARAFAQDQPDGAEPVDGVGDDAFLTHPVSFISSLYVAIDDRVLVVEYTEGLNADTPSADRMAALAEVALPAVV